MEVMSGDPCVREYIHTSAAPTTACKIISNTVTKASMGMGPLFCQSSPTTTFMTSKLTPQTNRSQDLQCTIRAATIKDAVKPSLRGTEETTAENTDALFLNSKASEQSPPFGGGGVFVSSLDRMGIISRPNAVSSA